MQLDHLCDVSWTYDFLHEVEQSERGDGRFASGVIHLPEGGEVLYALTGMSSLSDGLGVHVLTFQTAVPSYLWLNNTIAIGEGTIDVKHSRLAMRYYECKVEAPVPDFMA